MGSRTFVNDRFRFSFAKSLSRGLDVPLALTVLALSVFGLIMLYSASFDFSFNEYGSSTYMFARVGSAWESLARSRFRCSIITSGAR